MTVVSFSMAYRSFRGGSGRLDTRLDTPPSINRRHPNSCLAPPHRPDTDRASFSSVENPRNQFNGKGPENAQGSRTRTLGCHVRGASTFWLSAVSLRGRHAG